MERGQIDLPPGKTTLKKPGLIGVKDLLRQRKKENERGKV